MVGVPFGTAPIATRLAEGKQPEFYVPLENFIRAGVLDSLKYKTATPLRTRKHSVTNMLQGAIDFPGFQKENEKIYNNFRAAAVRRKFEEEIRKTLSRIKEEQLVRDVELETEYSATVGTEWNKVPAAWRQKALAELVQKYPLEEETISWWQWQNRGSKSGFKRNAHFTTPVEISLRHPPAEGRRFMRPQTAYEMYNRDFPKATTSSWFHPLPSSHGVVRILRDF